LSPSVIPPELIPALPEAQAEDVLREMPEELEQTIVRLEIKCKDMDKDQGNSAQTKALKKLLKDL
jgi:hypothetical protein